MTAINLQPITAMDALLSQYTVNVISIGGDETVTQVIVPLFEGAELIVFEGNEGVLRLGGVDAIEFPFTDEIAQFFLTDFHGGGSAKGLLEMIIRKQDAELPATA